MLDGEQLWRSEWSVRLRVQGAVLAMQRVDNYQPPTWPGSAVMRLDLRAEGEFDRSETRALELGATRAQFQPDPRWRVLSDPAGHLFCITTVVPPE
ncbi:MAG: VOC family protein [Acidimicrobiales bacterium]